MRTTEVGAELDNGGGEGCRQREQVTYASARAWDRLRLTVVIEAADAGPWAWDGHPRPIAVACHGSADGADPPPPAECRATMSEAARGESEPGVSERRRSEHMGRGHLCGQLGGGVGKGGEAWSIKSPIRRAEVGAGLQ